MPTEPAGAGGAATPCDCPLCVCHVDDGLVQEWVSKARAVAKSKGLWPLSPAGAGEAEQLQGAVTQSAREIRRLEQALAEKDAALGRVQALVEKWRAHAAQLTRDTSYECRPANVITAAADELAAALRGEVQP